MKNILSKFSVTHLLLTFILLVVSQQVEAQGFYKDIYMDGGIKLTSRKDLPAARRLGLSIEHFASAKGTNDSPLTMKDTLLQTALFCGDENDTNGILLYPDGQPRFRMIYVNGGRATQHGVSLTQKGLDNIRKFVANGGSYVGTCAGMFIASKNVITSGEKPKEGYLHIWPGYAHSTKLLKAYTGHFVEKGSPLLKYYDFGGDLYIDSVRHNGGGYAYTETGFPKGTEILTRYDYNHKTGKNKDILIHQQISSWAYKASKESGRVVVTGSHPEGVTSGERLDMMSALVQYALDGNGTPKIKGELKRGVTRTMNKSTQENNPDYTKIGDKQYHHFVVNIPKRAKNIKVTLEGQKGYDLNLYMAKGTPAFANNAQFINISKGGNKALFENKLEAGEWYIAVECDTTVEVVKEEWGEKYVGDLSVLNGVSYLITVDWK
ncbi:MAG: BPL-N domain-containing protein [Bacteroidales bacterium]